MTLDKLSGKEGEGTAGKKGLGLGLLRNRLSWKHYWAIVISKKAFSVYGEETDNYMIKDSDMPLWMDLDTLYIFKFENDKDDSEYKIKISGNDLTVIEPIQGEGLKGNYQCLIESKDQYNFFGVEYCKEMNKWVCAMRKIKLTVEEVARTKKKSLMKNIDPIISLYKNKVA